MKYPRLARISSAVVFWGSWPVSYARLRLAERTRVLVIAGGTHVLVLEPWHAPNRWSLPGGGIHNGEEHVAAAARELYEETSVALGAEKFVSLGNASFRDRGLLFRCHYYFAEVSQQFHIEAHPPEVLEVAWLPLAEIDQGIHAVGADYAQAVSSWRNLIK